MDTKVFDILSRSPTWTLEAFRCGGFLRTMAYFGVFILIFFISGSLIQAASVDDLPGWMGEIRPSNLHNKADTHSDLSQRDQIIDPTRIIQLAWKPRAFLYKGFLSNKECAHLMELANDKLEKSMVADNESGKGVLSEIRTSSGMFIDKGHDEIVRRIEKRIATWSFLPEENGEALQVLKYQHGEKYEPHYDFFQDKVNIQLGGHRIATVLMYLSNVTKGGETVFPNALDHRVKDDTWSDCAKKALSVKPTKGDALLFFSLSTEGTTDTMSLHGSCPVIEGEKWSATKWIHVDSFDKPRKETGCVDENVSCAEWAAIGECQKNPIYMVGTERSPGKMKTPPRKCALKKTPLLGTVAVKSSTSRNSGSKKFEYPKQTHFCKTRNQFYKEYGLSLEGKLFQHLSAEDMSDDDWMSVFIRRPEKGSKIFLSMLRPEFQDDCRLLFHQVYQGPPTNNELTHKFATLFAFEKCERAMTDPAQHQVAWAVFAETVVNHCANKPGGVEKKQKSWLEMNGRVVPTAAVEDKSKRTTAHATKVEEQSPQSTRTYDDAWVTMHAAKVKQMVVSAKSRLDGVRKALQTTRGELVQVKESMWKVEGTNCAAFVIRQQLQQLQDEYGSLHCVSASNAALANIQCQIDILLRTLAVLEVEKPASGSRKSEKALENEVSEYEVEEITYMEQLKFCESLLGQLKSGKPFLIVPSPSMFPKESEAKVNMPGACVACGLPLSAYDILCVCMLPCGHKYHIFCFAGWIRMKAEVCASHGCKELVAKIGRTLLSPKGFSVSRTIDGNSTADDVMSDGANLGLDIGELLTNGVDYSTHISTARKEGIKKEINDADDVKSDGANLGLDSGELPIDDADQSTPILTARKEGIQEEAINMVDVMEIPTTHTSAGANPDFDIGEPPICDDIQFTPVSTPSKEVQDAAKMESIEVHDSPNVTIAEAVRKAKKRRKYTNGKDPATTVEPDVQATPKQSTTSSKDPATTIEAGVKATPRRSTTSHQRSSVSQARKRHVCKKL